MNLEILNTGYNTGNFNMKFDIELAENIKKHTVVFRLYKWNPYCISLGANQNIVNIDKSKTDRKGIDVVKRPTGGRAILHSEELTYSTIIPITSSISAKKIYYHINIALKKGLELYNPKLSKIEIESNQVHFSEFYKEDKSAICFAISAKNELKFDGKKLVGSAQRKLGNCILQHGSILCGPNHLRIIDYLNLPGDKAKKIEKEIENTTTDLQSILNEEIDYIELEKAMIDGFKTYFNLEFEKFIDDGQEKTLLQKQASI